MLNFTFLFLFCPQPYVDSAHACVLRSDYEKAVSILALVNPSHDNYAEYNYLKAVCAYALNDKPEAARRINLLLNSPSTIPDRYYSLAYAMKEDLVSWEPDDLANVSRKMRVVKDRLDNFRTGQVTMDRQREVVKDLDKLIKEKEDALNAAINQAKPNPSSPLPDSVIAGASGSGQVNEKRLANLAKVWGTMPSAEREKAMIAITRDLPPRYKEVIENYFKVLARSKP